MFKTHFQADFKDILETINELQQLEKMEKGEKVSAREKGFNLLFEKVANRVCLMYLYHRKDQSDGKQK